MKSAQPMVHRAVDDTQRARRIAHAIRKRALELAIKQNGCYLSQALSSAEIFAALYTCVLNIGPSLAPGPFPGVPRRANTTSAPNTMVRGPRDTIGSSYRQPTTRSRYTRRWSRLGAGSPRNC